MKTLVRGEIACRTFEPFKLSKNERRDPLRNQTRRNRNETESFTLTGTKHLYTYLPERKFNFLSAFLMAMDLVNGVIWLESAISRCFHFAELPKLMRSYFSRSSLCHGCLWLTDVVVALSHTDSIVFIYTLFRILIKLCCRRYYAMQSIPSTRHKRTIRSRKWNDQDRICWPLFCNNCLHRLVAAHPPLEIRWYYLPITRYILIRSLMTAQTNLTAEGWFCCFDAGTRRETR